LATVGWRRTFHPPRHPFFLSGGWNSWSAGQSLLYAAKTRRGTFGILALFISALRESGGHQLLAPDAVFAFLFDLSPERLGARFRNHDDVASFGRKGFIQVFMLKVVRTPLDIRGYRASRFIGRAGPLETRFFFWCGSDYQLLNENSFCAAPFG
jgi:hypothetical protein